MLDLANDLLRVQEEAAVVLPGFEVFIIFLSLASLPVSLCLQLRCLSLRIVSVLSLSLFHVGNSTQPSIPLQVDVALDTRPIEVVEEIFIQECLIVASMVYPPNGRDGFKLYDTLAWGEDGTLNLEKGPIHYEGH